MLIKSSVSLIFLIISFAAAYAQKPSVGTEFSIVNGLATYLPKPEYPLEAKDFCASGVVSIKVEINEKGDVISAETVTGDELLREPAIEAAKKAKFRVTTNNREAIKVKGIIVYNFSSEQKCIVVGVVNKRALNLPLPKIPNLNQPKHLKINEEQIVAIQIIVDVSGKVTAARALTGHPMLRRFCESAARQAKFSPVPEVSPAIKVKALFIYKFKPDGTIETDIETDDKTVIGTPINLVEPPPPFCNCRGLGGQIMIQAKIDKQGNVSKAIAFSGHPFLRKICEKAALESKFLPTDVNANIRINYNFDSNDGGRTAKIKNIEIKEVKIEK